MSDFTPISALLGGVLIGGGASLLLLYEGRVAGISGIFENALLAPPEGRAWRVPFLVGLAVVGLVASLVSGRAIGPAIGGSASVVAAGLLVGFGTRLSNGCTSGHGVAGLARLSVRSLVATLTFIAVGMITTFVVLHRGGR